MVEGRLQREVPALGTRPRTLFKIGLLKPEKGTLFQTIPSLQVDFFCNVAGGPHVFFYFTHMIFSCIGNCICLVLANSN